MSDPRGAPVPDDPLRLFGRFVGSWDVESSLVGPGEWHFAWILGGTAIQDVISPVGAPPEQQGMTVRAYDPASGLWHAFYTCPRDGEFVLLTGRAEGDRIVQLGHDLRDRGRRLRWSFSAIEPASFRWTGEVSTDGGATWRLTHEMRAKRRT